MATQATKDPAARKEAGIGTAVGRSRLILYLDSSAIVKRYVSEPGSAEIQNVIASAEVTGTVVVSRTEVTAALRRSVRTGTLTEVDAKKALGDFVKHWPDLVRTRVTERLAAHAASLAWSHDLRGYDAIHLASAAAWQQALGRAVVIATFDQRLWKAATNVGLTPFPQDLPALIESWQAR